MTALLLALALLRPAEADDPPAIQVVQPGACIRPTTLSFLVPEARYDVMLSCLEAKPRLEADLAACLSTAQAALGECKTGLEAAQTALGVCHGQVESCVQERVTLRDQAARYKRQRNTAILVAGGTLVVLGGTIAIGFAL
jgi:hypothetical protein